MRPVNATTDVTQCLDACSGDPAAAYSMYMRDFQVKAREGEQPKAQPTPSPARPGFMSYDLFMRHVVDIQRDGLHKHFTTQFAQLTLEQLANMAPSEFPELVASVKCTSPSPPLYSYRPPFIY
jgi:hypothetical protein